jgi:hypothetical protein
VHRASGLKNIVPAVRVLCGCQVFFFSSQDDNAGPVTFLRLHTNATCGAGADALAEDGAEHEGRTGRRVCLPLVVTESHYVRLHDGSLKAAFAVEVGDVISYYDDGKKVGPHSTMRAGVVVGIFYGLLSPQSIVCVVPHAGALRAAPYHPAPHGVTLARGRASRHAPNACAWGMQECLGYMSNTPVSRAAGVAEVRGSVGGGAPQIRDGYRRVSRHTQRSRRTHMPLGGSTTHPHNMILALVGFTLFRTHHSGWHERAL